jgi:hypothetical protein
VGVRIGAAGWGEGGPAAGLPIPARAASISSMTSHSRSSVWSVAGAGDDSASDGGVVGSASGGEIVGVSSAGEIVGVSSAGEIVGLFRWQWGGWRVVSSWVAWGARRKRSCSWPREYGLTVQPSPQLLSDAGDPCRCWAYTVARFIKELTRFSRSCAESGLFKLFCFCYHRETILFMKN